jgi:DNA-binding SARP family transcriptional activator/predicted ATPase
MARLCVRLFGTFQVTLDGVAVSGFASDRVRALLAYLAVEADQPQRREKLAGLLWPDCPEASAHANLRTALANLRQVVGDASATPPHLLISRQAIQFNCAASAWIDVVSYTELSSLADLAALEQATRLYRGDFLEGFSLGDASLFEEWALLSRERYRRLALDSLRRLADGYGQRGEYEQALPHAWRQVELDPWRESAHQQLMWLLALSGRRTEALVQYETCCRLLAEELGVAPAETTVTLYDQIRSGQLAAPERPPVRPSGSAVEPLSFSRQDEAAGAERPVFVARESELDRLSACLDLTLAGQGRTLFVCGEAGSGKTALMAEFAQRAMETHRDLVVASGECSAYSGFGDPYLPFRGIWAMLTGDVQARWIAGAIRLAHAQRLQAALPATIEALLERGPQVLDVLVPKASLLSCASLAGHDGDPWLGRLRERIEHWQVGSEYLGDSRLFQQTTNVLRELSGLYPLLLIVDDLQWADPASLSLLFHLGRRLQGSCILLLAAYRPEEVDLEPGGQQHPLQKLLAEFRRTYGDVRVDLNEFEETRGRAFVDAWLDTEPNRLDEDFRSILFKHTTGHPLFTIELLRAMQERGELFQDEAGCWTAGQALDWSSLPARVEGVIEDRLGRLDEELREILNVASVEGEQFTVQVVARVAEIDERRLLRNLSRHLERRHRLVRWLGGLQVAEQHLLRYRFAHGLFQQYLYSSLSPGERQILHQEIAAALEGLYQGHTEAIAPQLAQHYSEAGDDPLALHYLTLTADAALAKYASHEAELCYRKALDLVQESVPRAHLLEGLGRALARQGHLTEAPQAWREAIELRQPLGDLEGMARLYARSSDAAWWGGNQAASLRLCEEGLKATAGAPESAGRARLLHEAARAAYFHGSPEQAGSLCREALGMAERLDVADVQADALITLGGLPGQAPQDVLALFVKAAQLTEDANLPGIAFRAHNNLAIMKGVIYGVQAACGELQRAVALSRQTGNIAQEMLALGNLLEGQLALGEIEQARASLSRMRQLAAECDDPSSSAGRIRRLEAAVLLRQGEWVQATSLLRASQAEEREQGRLQGLYNVDLLLARVLVEAHTWTRTPGPTDWKEVESTLTEALDIGAMIGETDTNVWCRSYLTAMYADQGRLKQAHNQLSQARTMAQEWLFPPVEAALLWADGRLATAERRWAEALTAWENLVEIYAQCGLRWDRARTLVEWATVHVSRGEVADLSQACSLLQESHALFQEMGISHYAELVQKRLGALHGQVVNGNPNISKCSPHFE